MDEDRKRISNLEHEVAQANAIIRNLEKNLDGLKSQISSLVARSPQSRLSQQSPETATENKLINRLADDVTALVGLKEAVTWEYRWLKWLWVALLFAGIVLTAYFIYDSTAEYFAEPSATKVKVVDHANYHYPPIHICPHVWLDAPKALSLGLSIDGLKFSLGFINSFGDKVQPTNITSAKKEFFDFFDTHNFTCYEDYLLRISVDVPLDRLFENYSSTLTTSALCGACDSATLPKVVLDGMVCYELQLTPEKSHRSRITDPFVSMKVIDRSQGLIRSSLWRVFVDANPLLRSSSATKLVIEPFSDISLRITSQKFSTLKSRESPCVFPEEVPENYTTETCIAECLYPLYDQYLNCTPFDLTIRNSKLHPLKLCNIFDRHRSMSFWQIRDVVRAGRSEVLASNEADVCQNKCQHRCKKIVYETTRQEDFAFSDYNWDVGDFIAKARLSNLTMVALQIENAAVNQGGITTWTEISTISFTSFMGTVGGALGLFVGGTIMTFVQLIMFCVKLGLDRRKKQ